MNWLVNQQLYVSIDRNDVMSGLLFNVSSLRLVLGNYDSHKTWFILDWIESTFKQVLNVFFELSKYLFSLTISNIGYYCNHKTELMCSILLLLRIFCEQTLYKFKFVLDYLEWKSNGILYNILIVCFAAINFL